MTWIKAHGQGGPHSPHGSWLKAHGAWLMAKGASPAPGPEARRARAQTGGAPSIDKKTMHPISAASAPLASRGRRINCILRVINCINKLLIRIIALRIH